MKKTLIYISVTTLLTTVVVLVTVFVYSNISSNPDTKNTQNQPIVSTENPKEAVGTVGSIAIPGFKQMTMKAGQLLQDVNLYNPAENSCYMAISILLPDNTLLYRSGMLEPGNTIEQVEISKKLEPGVYDEAILQYSCYSIEEIKELNGAETIFTLEVVQ